MQHRIVFLDRETIPAHITIGQPSIDHRWIDYPLTDANHILKHAQGADIIVTNKVVLNRETLIGLNDLKHIAVFATGYNNIDINTCRELGISVSNTRDYAVRSVPEHTLAMIFALKKHLFAYRDSLQAGQWQTSPYFYHYVAPTQDLAGSQIGIIGSGSLGQAMAKLAAALGMKVVFSGRKNASKALLKNGYEPFENVIRESDIISLHCPLNAETENLIALKEMKMMKPSALLINSSRGGLVNEHDLVTALKDNIIAGAAMDVARQEPLEENSPLLNIIKQPNFILTPHVAWMSDEAMTTQAAQVIENIEFFSRGNTKNLVT